MGPFRQIERFVGEHRPHGQLSFGATEPVPDGYRVSLRCPCGGQLERLVTPEDADDDLLYSTLLAMPN